MPSSLAHPYKPFPRSRQWAKESIALGLSLFVLLYFSVVWLFFQLQCLGISGRSGQLAVSCPASPGHLVFL